MDGRLENGRFEDEECGDSSFYVATCYDLGPIFFCVSVRFVSLHRHVQWFRSGLVFKAHRLLYHSNLGLRLIKKMRRAANRCGNLSIPNTESELSRQGGGWCIDLPKTACGQIAILYNPMNLAYRNCDLVDRVYQKTRVSCVDEVRISRKITARPLSREFGTYKIVTARFWSWLLDESL